jgi:sterol desaturase/sphingolipid hydroxylase (fatty acid hydroxylase superfamily)
MGRFLDVFADMSSGQKLVWVFLCLTLFWVLEGAVPLVRFEYAKWKHARVNLFFLATSLLINASFTAATAGVYVWAELHGYGLLRLVEWPFWVELLLAVLALDLVAQWFAHYLLHRVKWMWKLHLVHHSDTHVDATTGTRHHPGDYVVRELFSLATVLICGIPLAAYVFYRIVTIFFTYFTHANIAVPTWIDRPLSWVFVTPNMHKFHHHVERPWTDSNFGNVFSLWDRLFGTLVYDDPRHVRYGVDTLAGRPDEEIAYQLKVPFDGSIKTDY